MWKEELKYPMHGLPPLEGLKLLMDFVDAPRLFYIYLAKPAIVVIYTRH